MKVGVIGLGTMGMGAALNLVRKGHQVTGLRRARGGARGTDCCRGHGGRQRRPSSPRIPRPWWCSW